MVQHNRQGCFRNPPSHALEEQGTVKGKELIDRRRGEKKILKRGPECTLPAYLGQLKTGQGKTGLFGRHLWCPTNLQGYGIEQNRCWTKISSFTFDQVLCKFS